MLPKLPQPSGSKGTSSALSRLATTVSIGTGFLFEKALVPYLREKFPTYTLVEQPKLSYASFSGTADYLLTNAVTSHAIVIDAKAFRADTLRDIKERKLTDNWSYPTQLALYHVAAQEQLGAGVQVDAFWYIWSVSKAKLFTVEQTYNKSEKLALLASRRADLYLGVKHALESGDYKAAASLACSNPSECLLPKGYFFGNVCAATKFHYNPYADLFFPEQDPDSEDYGQPLEGEPLQLLVEKLMHDTTGTNTTYYRDYLLTKGYPVS